MTFLINCDESQYVGASAVEQVDNKSKVWTDEKNSIPINT